MRQDVLDRLHKEQVTLLKTIDSFCRNKGIQYYLIGGTLLGAVRHKGFIPWDDDIDIAMPREDYDVFIKTFQEFVGDKYFVQTCITDKGYGRDFAKIRVNNTIFLEEVDAHVENRHHGIFLDVFVLENQNEKNSAINKLKLRISHAISSYIVCRRGKIKSSWKHMIFRLFSMNFLIKMRDKLRRGKGECYWVSFLGSIKKECYNEPVELEFEGLNCYAPKEYDMILRHQYGDYMKLPPIEKRVTHNPIRISFDTNGSDEILD